MITNPSGNPASWPATVERRDDGDGTAGFWAQTFDLLLNRTAYLYDQLLGSTNGLAVRLASQLSGAVGTALVGQRAITDANQGNLAAGTLAVAIAALWSGKAGLNATNTFTGPRIRSGPQATDDERTLAVDPTFTAFTFATSQDTLTVSYPAAHQTWTATTSGAAAGTHTVDVIVLASNISKGVQIIRDDASVICNLGANGYAWCRLKLVGSRWILVGIGGDTFSSVTPV